MSDCDKGFQESLELIKRTIKEEGPFDGIMGFSQGAALSAIICMTEIAQNFKFAVLFSPFMSPCSKHAQYYGEKAEIPTLFVYGKGDQVVNFTRSQALMAYFGQAEAVCHDGGHFVPASGKQKQCYLDFLGKFT